MRQLQLFSLSLSKELQIQILILRWIANPPNIRSNGYYWPLAVAGCPFMSVDVADCFFHVDCFWVISYAKVNKTKE
jgi:hypothetical protein